MLDTRADPVNGLPHSTCASSTLEQRPDLQRDALAAYAGRADLKFVATFADVAVSGRREGRPPLAALMQAARRRDIGCVLVWKFDRFARSTRHLFGALAEFDHLGVRFVSVQDQIDTASPMGRAMFTIIGAVAPGREVRPCGRARTAPSAGSPQPVLASRRGPRVDPGSALLALARVGEHGSWWRRAFSSAATGRRRSGCSGVC